VSYTGYGSKGGEDSHEGKDEDNGSGDAVYEPHGAEVEVGTELVDTPCDAPPPAESAYSYEDESGHIMIPHHAGIEEIHAGKDAYNEKDNERIGDGEDESGEDFTAGGGAVAVVVLEARHGLFAKQIDAEGHEHDRANELNHSLVARESLLDEREPEAGDEAIEQIGESRPYTGEEAGVVAAIEGALDAEHPHGAHGSRDDNAHDEGSQYGVNKGLH